MHFKVTVPPSTTPLGWLTSAALIWKAVMEGNGAAKAIKSSNPKWNIFEFQRNSYNCWSVPFWQHSYGYLVSRGALFRTRVRTSDGVNYFYACLLKTDAISWALWFLLVWFVISFGKKKSKFLIQNDTEFTTLLLSAINSRKTCQGGIRLARHFAHPQRPLF